MNCKHDWFLVSENFSTIIGPGTLYIKEFECLKCNKEKIESKNMGEETKQVREFSTGAIRDKEDGKEDAQVNINLEVKEVDGKRVFATGAVRDSELGKEDLSEGISWLALKRLALYMDKNATRYGRGNWTLGLSPDCLIRSFLRHTQKFLSEWNYGVSEEKSDHLSGMAFNLLTLMHELELFKYGKGRAEISKHYKKLYLEENADS